MTYGLDDQKLFDLMLSVEDEMEAKGHDAKWRHYEVPLEIMRRLGFDGFAIAGEGRHPVLIRLHQLQQMLYRPKDVAVGGFHGGIFMFRGIVAKINVPIMFGRVTLEPLKMSDLTETQVHWLCRREADIDAYISTFADIYDFSASVHPMGDYDVPPAGSSGYLQLASFQLQAASAALVEAFDTRGAIQSAMIGAELALKAALLGAGADEERLTKLGHNIEKTAKAVYSEYPNFNFDAVIEQMKIFPHFVKNRYSSTQPNRQLTGQIVMASQFVCGEIARTLTNGSFEAKLIKD